jgi:hypothetical protein
VTPWTASFFIEWKNDSMWGVVGDLAWPVHALHEAEGSESIPERIRGILDTPVAVEDDARTRASMKHGAIERRQREVRVFGRAEAPAEHPARVPIHDHGQIAPAAAELQVGNVAASATVCT